MILNSNSSEASARRLVYYAAERTLLSWVRTATGLMALGFVVERFSLFLEQMFPKPSVFWENREFFFWFGTLLIVLAVVFMLFAAIRYSVIAKQYKRTEIIKPKYTLTLSIIFSVFIAMAGVVLVIFLLSNL